MSNQARRALCVWLPLGIGWPWPLCAAGVEPAKRGSWEDIWRREAISVRDHGAPADGLTDATSAVRRADAAAQGRPLLFPPGKYLITSSHAFVSAVVMMPGALIQVVDPRVWLRFAAGFQAGLQPCLDTDGPTQFLEIEKIHPQWFGPCGLDGVDSTQALTRALRACRAADHAGTSTPDASLGCHTVYLTFGKYRCNDVPVYCGTHLVGEIEGSLHNALIQQIDRNRPALLICPKNYALDGRTVNNGVGQNSFTTLGFRSESIADSLENAPIVRFLSPAQATEWLNMPGDSAGKVGHIDTIFQRTWWKDSAGSCIGCDDGVMTIHIRDSTFDVVRRAVRYAGNASGILRSYNNIYYGCIRGAVENVSGSETASLFFSDNDEYKAGNTNNSNPEYRRAIHWRPARTVPGSLLRIYNGRFLRTDGLKTRIGGPVFVENVETVEIVEAMFKDPDSANHQKAIHVGAGVRTLKLTGSIQSDDLGNYRNARLVSITQATPTLASGRISMQFVNNHPRGEIEAAVHSDYPIDGLDLGGSTFRGMMQKQLGLNVRWPRGYVGSTEGLPQGR